MLPALKAIIMVVLPATTTAATTMMVYKILAHDDCSAGSIASAPAASHTGWLSAALHLFAVVGPDRCLCLNGELRRHLPVGTFF